ncbi:carboxypeptidase-like regulatory domain-containing protein [Edaphobacter paludis]|uniref:Carboxypeptidase-like regulatory domain-containing protein n=1 Tax=Edaphobacter paludis TaxID=3035702 RepID=A0AAU7DAH6_9BACT
MSKRFTRYFASAAFALSVLLLPAMLHAQLSGKGTIQGTVTDPSGAIVPGATVKIVHNSTHTEHDQQTTGSGFYSVASLDPGVYTVTVTAPGFQAYSQENVNLDALQVFGLNVKLQVGATDTTITVSTAPAPLDTTNATLGTTIENETYEALPLNMGGAPRDPTAFVYLTPGVVSDGHSGQFNGGQSYHNETYIEGLAITDPAIQGNSQAINRGVSVDAVDQFQVQTSSTSAAYQGQGLQNYTLKSGTNQFHGRAFEYFRNTVLDTWGWSSKNVINPATGTATKPVERQNEYGGTLGGPILKNKLFFFGSYDGQRYLKGSNPSAVTVPTDAERTGDFSAAAPIYDPLTTVCNHGVCTRQQFSYNGKLNVIDPARFSKVAQFYQKFIPAATDKTAQVNNYLGGFNTGFNYSKYSIKLDYDLSQKNRLTLLYTYGNRAANPGCCDSSGLPQPFTATVGNSQFNMLGLIEDTYTINDHLVNQLKYGVSRGGGVSLNPGEAPQYAASASGLANLPTGQASDAAPRFGFSGNIAPASLGGTANSNNQGNSEYGTSYVLLDSMQYVRGRHSMSWGGEYQWLNDNDTSLTGGTYLNLNFSSNETAMFKPGTSTLNTATGAPYASFILGAVDGGSISDSRQVITTGARYYTFSPFFEDDIKVNQRLTVNLGLRWDLYSPFREVHNKLSFLDATRINPITRTPGALSFAGNGPDGCNCSTPVATWYKNFGPHIGFAYSVTPKTVIRGGFDIAYTHAGGVGGRGGGRQGTGQLGFSGGLSIASPDSGITPGLYLNAANNYALPSYAAATPNAAFGTGYTTTPGYTGSPNGVSYADPYLSRRAPYYENFNFGIQQQVLTQTVLSVNYSGSNGHFLGTGIGHGIYSNQLDPQYLFLGSLLTAPATTANIAAAKAKMPSFKLPYANFSPSASIGQALRPFAQYNGFSDVWGDMGNSNYSSLQVTLNQKPRRGLSYTINYTYSKMYDDTGTGRTAYGNNAYVERSLSTTDQPSNVSAYAVWEEPFAHGNGNRFVNALIKDYAISGIYRYTSGYPLAITASGCNLPFSGTCMPNLNPNFHGPIRINDGYGHNTYKAALATPFIDYRAFSVPSAYTIGNAPRTYAYALRGPGGDDTDMSLRRAFNLYERLKFTFQADVFNVTNNVRFADPNVVFDSNGGTTKQTFGKITGTANSSRDIQFSGRIDF